VGALLADADSVSRETVDDEVERDGSDDFNESGTEVIAVSDVVVVTIEDVKPLVGWVADELEHGSSVAMVTAVR
jgi:hypothetical protein